MCQTNSYIDYYYLNTILCNIYIYKYQHDLNHAAYTLSTLKMTVKC